MEAEETDVFEGVSIDLTCERAPDQTVGLSTNDASPLQKHAALWLRLHW